MTTEIDQDGRLSRAASALRRLHEEQVAELEAVDEGFPTREVYVLLARAHVAEVRAALAPFGFTPASYNRALIESVGPRFAVLHYLVAREGSN